MGSQSVRYNWTTKQDILQAWIRGVAVGVEWREDEIEVSKWFRQELLIACVGAEETEVDSRYGTSFMKKKIAGRAVGTLERS